MQIRTSSIADNTTVRSNGSMTISYDGIASTISIEPGGVVSVLSGGTAYVDAQNASRITSQAGATIIVV